MELDFDNSDLTTARAVMTVSALNRAVSGLLQRGFPLVRVSGEIANITRAASGHWYFTLKDQDAQVRCVMFRARNQLLGWAPRDGDDVEVNAIVSLYEARGEYQLCIEFMRRSGQGRLFEKFLSLKARLADEGLFGGERKRTLPRIPRRVAVVTSMHAAALCDLVTTLCRRAPYVGVIIYPVPVQGQGAGGQIAQMLNRISQRVGADGVEVVLLVRGGGSIEDLWAFNEEAVARAIVACALPVIVGVGHESDITIADFAADLRAPTPTAAAELVAPAAIELAGEFQRYRDRLQRLHLHRVQAATQRLDYAQRSLAKPRMPLTPLDGRVGGLRSRLQGSTAGVFNERHSTLQAHRERLLRVGVRQLKRPDDRLAALAAHAARRLNSSSMRLTSLAARLHALDPHAVLARGYSIVLAADGRAVTDAVNLQPGADLHVQFARGYARAEVLSISPVPEPEADGDRIAH